MLSQSIDHASIYAQRSQGTIIKAKSLTVISSTFKRTKEAIHRERGEQCLRIFSVRRSQQGNHNGSRKSQRLWGSLNTNFDARGCLLLLNHNRL
jgi:hypothetical protein